MTSEKFNDLTAAYAKELLYPLGFTQSGTHFYIHNTPNIMVFYKKTFKGMFEGFCIALTHDFFTNTTDDKMKLKLPDHLEDYPFSITLKALKEQYAKHRTATDFSYDTNFITREVLTTRQFIKSNPKDLISFNNIQDDKEKAQDYIKSSIDTVVKDGMKLLNEYSPVNSYLAVTRHKSADNTTLDRHKKELEKYFTDNMIEIPKRTRSWFDKLFND